jgi:putative ABC transport system permease protein
MWPRRRKPQDFSAEIQAHLDLEREELVEQGMSPDAADAAAKRAFGSRASSEELFYERTRWLWLDHLWHDVRVSLRGLMRSPGFTTAVVVMLSLAIGAGTAIFAIADEALFRPLPLPDPGQLTAVYNYDQSTDTYLDSSYPDYLDYRDRAKSFEQLSAYVRFPLGVSVGEQMLRMPVEAVTPEYFTMLRLPLLIGSNFSGESSREAMLSERFWRESFGADPKVVGATIRIERELFTIIGIVPAQYTGANLSWSEPPAVWIPLQTLATAVPRFGPLKGIRSARWLVIFGRRKPSVPVEQAQTELQSLAANIGAAEPSNKNITVMALEANRSKFWPAFRERISLSLSVFGIAAALMLLLACANISNLLLERALSRRREIGVRLALGAARARLIRQMLVECFVLVTPGFLGALLVSSVIGRLLSRFPTAIGGVTLSLDAKTDMRMLAIGFALSLAAIGLFGVLPALQGTRFGSHLLLNESGSRVTRRKEQWLRELMVVVQIAFTTALLIGAGLFARSLLKGYSIDPGFKSDHLIMANFDLNAIPLVERASFTKRVVDESAALPGIESAAVSPHMPLISGAGTVEVSTPNTMISASLRYAGPGVCETLGIPMRNGREFLPNERLAKIAIITAELAEQCWPNQTAVGRTVVLRRGSAAPAEFEVVGVAGSVRASSVWKEPELQVYVPQETSTPFWILRTRAEPTAQMQQMRAFWQRLAPNVPLWDLRTGSGIMEDALAPQRLAVDLFAAFGVLAITLASIGLFSLTASGVAHQTREIGIRMAIGAAPNVVVGRIVGRGLLITTLGLVVGMAAAIKLGRLASPLMPEVSANDAVTFSIVTVSMLAISSLAVLVPAYRAAHVDPITALRSE